MRHRMVVYSPVIGGRPASSAYAIPCGTSSAVSTNPATRSWRSHSGLYDHKLAMPGATRAITGSVRVEASGMDCIVPPMSPPSPVRACCSIRTTPAALRGQPARLLLPDQRLTRARRATRSGEPGGLLSARLTLAPSETGPSSRWHTQFGGGRPALAETRLGLERCTNSGVTPCRSTLSSSTSGRQRTEGASPMATDHETTAPADLVETRATECR